MESWLAVDPRDSKHLIAASIVLGQSGGTAVYASADGGATWARATHGSHADRLFPGLDPAVTFDEGNAYLVTLADRVAVWSSRDGGRSWGDPATVPGSGDRPFIGCDRSSSRARGTIYVSAKRGLTVFGHAGPPWHPDLDMITLSTSRDHGKSFDFPALFLPDPQHDALNVASDLLVRPDGGLVLALQTFDPNQDRLAHLLTAAYSIVVLEPNQSSFPQPRQVATWRTYGHADEGRSLFALGSGRLALDLSKDSFRNSLYFLWLDVVDGHYQVMTAFSRDGGTHWSTPVRVNDNGTGADQTNPAIAVNDEGVVGIVWNDRRADPSGRCYQLYFAASTNGGASYSPNQLLDQGFTCPVGKPSAGFGAPLQFDPAVDALRSEYRFKNGGDTQGIVGLPGGAFHLAWINGAGGELQLWSSVVVVDPASQFHR